MTSSLTHLVTTSILHWRLCWMVPGSLAGTWGTLLAGRTLAQSRPLLGLSSNILYEIIFFLAIVFSVQCNTWHRIFRHLSATENSWQRKDFLLCLSSIWILAIDSILATTQAAMSAACSTHSSRHATPHVESAYCRRQNASLTASWKVIPPNRRWGFRAWKVWLS